ASLSLDHASVSLRDVRVSGLLTVESSAHGHFLNTVVDHVVVRGGSAAADSSAFAHTTVDGGTITGSDLSDLGHIHLSGDSSTRTLRVTGEAVEGGVFHFDADARLTVETPFASTLVNRVDWRLAQGAQLTLNAGGVRNEADIVLDDASLRLTGVLPFTNPGTLTLRDGGTITLTNPFDFAELLDERNDLRDGRVVLDRDVDLQGSTLTLGANAGQWAVSTRRSLSNGVVNNADGQAFLVFGAGSFGPQSRLENVVFTGDVDTTASVR